MYKLELLFWQWVERRRLSRLYSRLHRQKTPASSASHEITAQQLKQVLDLAYETLPRFRDILEPFARDQELTVALIAKRRWEIKRRLPKKLFTDWELTCLLSVVMRDAEMWRDISLAFKQLHHPYEPELQLIEALGRELKQLGFQLAG